MFARFAWGRPWIYLALAAALGVSLLPLGPARHSTFYFTETTPPHSVSGRFLDVWIGGRTYTESIAIVGYPISEVISETNAADGKVYRVQWFERARLEAHPENAPPDDVVLGQLGREASGGLLQEPAFAPVPSPASTGPDVQWFPDSGHTLRGPFRAFWQANGGLHQFGFPISEELVQQFEGHPYTVQYFERSRFERPAGQAGPVTLGLLGRELYLTTGGTPTPGSP
jgi:hypothetical protein